MPSAAELSGRRLVRALHAATSGRPGQWRMLHELIGTARMDESALDRAVALAQREGWVEERMRSVCLTDAGRRLVED